MSFWDLSDGGAANENVEKEYEVPGGNMEPIPNNSDVLAYIKAVKWASKKDASERFIEIQWQVEKPETVANRVVFQKLWVADLDPTAKSEEKARQKRDKARKMLATIDANAKGRLMQSSDMPTDDSLSLALVDARMVVKAMEWSINDAATGETIKGNWISAVKPKESETSIGEALKTKPSTGGQTTPGGASGGGFGIDDDIPFAPEWRV